MEAGGHRRSTPFQTFHVLRPSQRFLLAQPHSFWNRHTGARASIHGTNKPRDRVQRPVMAAVEHPTADSGNWYATVNFWRPQAASLVDEATLFPALLSRADVFGGSANSRGVRVHPHAARSEHRIHRIRALSHVRGEFLQDRRSIRALHHEPVRVGLCPVLVSGQVAGRAATGHSWGAFHSVRRSRISSGRSEVSRRSRRLGVPGCSSCNPRQRAHWCQSIPRWRPPAALPDRCPPVRCP